MNLNRAAAFFLIMLGCAACSPSVGGTQLVQDASAQTAQPAAHGDALAQAGWNVTRADPEGLEATHPGGAYFSVQFIDLGLAETDALSDGDIAQSILGTLASQYEQGCPGLWDAPISLLADGAEQVVTSPNTCHSIARVRGGRAVAIISGEYVKVKKNARALAMEYGNKLLMGQALGVSVTPQAQAGSDPVQREGTGSTQAKGATTASQALEQIPANQRPKDVAFVGDWDSVSMSTQYVPWFLMPDGYAKPAECFLESSCERARYTGSGSNVRIATDEEVLDGEGDFRPFKPGERVSLSLGNVGGGSIGFGGGQVSSGTLQMTPDGRIIVSEDIANTMYAPGAIASTSRSGALSGTYHVDGYLIAIDDGAGNVRIGSIIRKYEGRDLYIYLNGELYWE